MEKDRLDPWGSTTVQSYERLHSEFGIERMGDLVSRLKEPSLHMRRGIDFGHRDLGRILDAIDNSKPFAVMSGIKPTHVFHLGNKMTADDMIYFQSLSPKATVFYCIADVEAYADNGITLQESAKIGIKNVADFLALGLNPEKAVIYKQSEEIRVMRLATIFSRRVTNNMLRAIYGERQIGLYMSALIQAADILMPQLPEFGGPKPVLVPVGADQDPHIRLARDLATSFADDFRFVPPSSIYHKLIKGLSGDAKMSKRTHSSSLTLEDTPSSAGEKVMSSFTGGRATVEEQRRLGGEPEKCPIYDLYLFHFAENDKHAKQVYDECVGGVRMCGGCKKEAATLVKRFLETHRKKRDSLTKDASELLAKSKSYLATLSG